MTDDPFDFTPVASPEDTDRVFDAATRLRELANAATPGPWRYNAAVRLALLEAAKAGQLLNTRNGETRQYFGDGTYRTGIAARVEEIRAAGWIQIGVRMEHDVRYWRLTDAGRAVLGAQR